MTSIRTIANLCGILHLLCSVLVSLGFALPFTTIRPKSVNQAWGHQGPMIHEHKNSDNAGNAVIVGGGPAGLLSAICLAQKSAPAFKILVYDRQPKPPAPTDENVWSNFSRHYLIGLGGRGIVALEKFGVWDEVKAVSVPVPGRQDWNPGSNKPVERFLTERKYGTYVLPRDKLVSVLNQHIVDNYAGHVDLFYQHEVLPVDFFGNGGNSVLLGVANMTDDTTAEEEISFQKRSGDVVVVADGAARAFANQIEKEDMARDSGNPFSVVRFEDKNQRVFKTFHFRLPSNWRKDLNYAVRSAGDRIVFDALPANNRGDFVGNLLFRKDDEMAQRVDPSLFREFLDKVLPQFSPMFDDDTVRKVAESPSSPLPMFRYIKPRMHHGKRCILLGDCAHTVKPYFGLGCNSALEDVKIFGDCIDNASNINDAILDFSDSRAKDIETLVKASANLDKPGFAGIVSFLIPIILDGIFHKLAPRLFDPNIIAMLQREDLTFQDVLERKQKDRIAQIVFLGLLSSAVMMILARLSALIISVEDLATATKLSGGGVKSAIGRDRVTEGRLLNMALTVGLLPPVNWARFTCYQYYGHEFSKWIDMGRFLYPFIALLARPLYFGSFAKARGSGGKLVHSPYQLKAQRASI
eukprot:scaffold1888_cov120-Cylindrotheca_fusiformis.AAC.23